VVRTLPAPTTTNQQLGRSNGLVHQKFVRPTRCYRTATSAAIPTRQATLAAEFLESGKGHAALVDVKRFHLRDAISVEQDEGDRR
jgi:hypothetical protein